MSDCLKELEIKNKMINILQAENKVYRNEQSGWVKEIERRQAKIRELEKLDLNVRELMLENKKLKKENKALRKDKWELEGINEACRKENEAYKEMWEEFKEYINNDVANNTYDYDILDVTEHYQKQIAGLQKKYLGGGE